MTRSKTQPGSILPSRTSKPGALSRVDGEGLLLVVRRAEELRPVELRPVELLLDTLERGVANGVVGPERHEPAPRGLCRGAHDRRVRLLAVGIRRGLFGRAELLLRATQLQVVAVL